MIMIRLMGGLGNQMFQYAFGASLAIKHKTELVIDDTLIADRSTDHLVYTHRNFELELFKNLKYRWATPEEIVLFNGAQNASAIDKIKRRLKNSLQPKKLVIQKNNQLNDYLKNSTDNTCYVGRWQSFRFFADHEKEIKNGFEMSKPAIDGIDQLIEEIKSVESVCLHIRRGDLVTSPLYSKTIGALDMNYYSKAMELVSGQIKQPVYFVFSDDINWCKQNLKLKGELRFIEDRFAGSRADGHFYLMKQCKNFIISNSTFAWWTAYLSINPDKKVIYPKNWYKDPEMENSEMCPNGWIKL